MYFKYLASYLINYMIYLYSYTVPKSDVAMWGGARY